MTEREQFEAWAKARYAKNPHFWLRQIDDGGYSCGMADSAWEAWQAAPPAQQAQRPDFHDEWTGFLKDGETPFERFMRERKDLTSLTKLYQRALEENEQLRAQQPQAEAVPDCGEAGHDDGCCGNRDCLPSARKNAPQQAEAVPLDAYCMADRLMGWKLPVDFNPDGGISFNREGRNYSGYQHEWPTGTNLLTHEQAKAMFEYVLKEQP